MDHLQKVMWSEGMFLTPHHFQQADRYHQTNLHSRMQAIQPTGYGICELKANEDALTNGEFILQKCWAILPDGLCVDIPDMDSIPETRPVEPYFDSKKEQLGVYIATPVTRSGQAGCSVDGNINGRPTRYRRQFVNINDDNSGTNEREISAARKDLRILFDGEPLDDYISLKIAELERTATGTFALRTEFVPPTLFVGSNPFLMTILKRLVEVLSTKSSDLSKKRRQRSQGLVEFTMSEAANFWLLHTANAYIPSLMHYYNSEKVHPEQVYLELGRLCGELYTFAGEGHPKDLPRYIHTGLSDTFSIIEQKLRDLLETVVPTRCQPIPLQRVRECLYTAQIPDEGLLESGTFYMAIMANVPEEKVAQEIPIKMKMTSVDRIDKLIAQALRGIPVRHLPTPPAEIPVQPGRTYFQIDKQGDHWDAVKMGRAMSVFIPPDFTDLKAELMAVKDS